MSRYTKFFKALRTSPSMEVSVLANIVGRDVRTTTGSNLHLIGNVTGLDPWRCFDSQVKRVMKEKLVKVPEMDKWRLPYLGKLLEQRLIESVCVN